MGTIAWESLPAERVSAIEARTGPIVKAEPVTKGMMPGLTAVLHSENGQRYFLKASPVDGPAAHLFKQEMAANIDLPDTAPVPEMRLADDNGGWLLMLFDYLDARDADLTPASPDLQRILPLIQAFSAITGRDTTPPAATYVGALQAKATRMLEKLPDGQLREMYAAAIDDFGLEDISGNTLVHYDLHRSNIRITSGGTAYAVDLAFLCKGTPYMDAALLVPHLIRAGHSPAAAEKAVAELPAWQHAPSGTVTALCALWTMFRDYKARYGPEHSRPTRARAAQAGQSWLSYRMR